MPVYTGRIMDEYNTFVATGKYWINMHSYTCFSAVNTFSMLTLLVLA